MIVRRNHPTVRRVRALRQRKRRRETGLYLIEGVRVAHEAIAASVPIVEAVYSPRLVRTEFGEALARELRARSIPLHEAADGVLEALADADSHQGVVLVAEQRPAPLEPLVAGAGRILVIACGVREPGNVGALVRVTEGLGGAGLIAAGSAEPWNPKSVRAAAGSLFRLPVSVADDPVTLLPMLRASDRQVIAAVADAGRVPGRIVVPAALMLGAEGSGLPEAVRQAADLLVTVPLTPPVESLSVATAAAVLLYAGGVTDRP